VANDGFWWQKNESNFIRYPITKKGNINIIEVALYLGGGV